MSGSRKEIFHKIFLLLCAAIIFHAVWLMVSADIGVLRFFTVLSNLLLGAAFTARIALYKRDCEFLRHLSFAALIAIIVTCVVYNFVLVPFAYADNIFSGYANFVTHFLSGVFALSSYVFFEDKGKLRYKHALTAMVFPVGYWFVFVTPIFDFYPYFFMNPTEIGLGAAILWFAGLVAAFAGVAFGLVWMDSSAEASRVFRILFIVFLGLLGFAAIAAILFIGGLAFLLWLLLRPPTIPPEREFFALENSTDIPAEGISAATGISLYISLRGNGIIFQAHDRDYILVTYRLCGR
ncbi:MAG: Pr6Pr family membrane protein [Defluviitaleaceae bacterium]|nr:Pr6Pr family membrane protein [Defluviitaleaceae bacterium]MCL2261596.1 Pr6Pr family membrane protein [Defluviitaleaceae bacterium]